MDIELGENLSNDCKHIGGRPLFAVPKGDGGTLGMQRNVDGVSKHLALENTDFYDQVENTGAQVCADEAVFLPTKGRLLRLAIKALAQLNPVCFSLARQNMMFNAITGEGQGPATPGQAIHYRGAEFYPFFLDPTDPDKGGSGYIGYSVWALKRGSGGTRGACFTGEGGSGTFNWTSIGVGEVLASGSIVDGVIVDFPPNDSVLDVVDFSGSTTGACADFYAGASLTAIISYSFCVYPAGVDPATHP